MEEQKKKVKKRTAHGKRDKKKEIKDKKKQKKITVE